MKEPTHRATLALVLAVLAVAGVAVATWASGDGALDAAMPAPAAAPAANVEAAEGGTTSAPTAPTAPAPQPFEDGARRAAAPRTAGPGEFLVRGRCIGEDGAPLADCVAVLMRGIANTPAGAEWRAQHPGAEPPAPVLAHTGSDGAFALAIEANPAFAALFRGVQHDRVPVHTNLDSPPAGTEIDLGDVVLWRGVRVVGSVRFDDGTPCAKVRVVLQDHDKEHAPQRGSTTPVPHVYLETRTREDGTFEFQDPVRPCTWNLDASDAGVHPTPFHVKTDLARPVETVAVVVEAPLLDQAITGRVVDDKGQPVADATIHASPVRGSLSVRASRSAADGTFSVVPLRSNAGAPVRLQALKESMTSTSSNTPVAWGSHGVELVVKGPPGIVLRVTDEALQPIEEYAVQTEVQQFGAPSRYRGQPSAQPVLSGPHPDGRCQLPPRYGVQRTVLLTFPDAADRAPRLVSFRADPTTSQQVDVVAARGADLTLRVVDGSGAIVAGAPVEFYDLQGDSMDPKGDAPMPLLQGVPRGARASLAVLLCQRVTDGDGVVRVRMPTDTGVGIAAPGPGHVPATEDLGLVAPGTSRTLVVRRGARLTGRVGPAEMLQLARRRAGVTPFGEWPQHLRLRIELGPVGALPADATPFARAPQSIDVAPDGTFSAAGLEAGSFDAFLRSSPATNSLGTQPIEHRLATVHLVDGQSSELVAEAPLAAPSRGTFRLLCNGAPLVQFSLLVQSTPPTRCLTDAHGRFSFEAAPGSYRVLVVSEPNGKSVQLLSETPAVLPQDPGAAPADIVCRAAKVRLRALDAQGKPLAARPLRSRVPDAPELWMPIGDTGPDGQLERWLRVGSHELEVRIGRDPTAEEVAEERKRLQDQLAKQPASPGAITGPESLDRFAQIFARQRLAAAAPWVPLGTLAIESEADAAVEVRMPPR